MVIPALVALFMRLAYFEALNFWSQEDSTDFKGMD